MIRITILTAEGAQGNRGNWPQVPRVGEQVVLGAPHAAEGRVVDVAQVVWRVGADGEPHVDVYCVPSAYKLMKDSTSLEPV